MGRLETIAFADLALRQIEAKIRCELAVLRAVALFDRDFKDIAIEVFGGREVQRIDARKRHPTVESALAPKSGKHRTEIRRRFMVALEQLVAALEPVKPAAPTAPAETAHTEPSLVPAAFFDDRGYMRPWDEIRDVILGWSETDDGDLRGGTD